ncbi:MAG: hypothetical protein Q4E69_06510 [Bacilli bacterium]|nr:hypothetical protein [Bacilli bacterium]
MLKSINIDKVKQLDIYHINYFNNKCLYTDGKYIYDIKEKELDADFKDLLKEINEKDYSFVVKPVHLITDHGKAKGYSRIDMKQKSLLNLVNRPLEQKKKLLLKTFDLVEEISNHDMVYSDFQLENVLVDEKNEKLTLCNLDGLRKREDDWDRKIHFLRGFGLLLSYYYNVDSETARVAVMNGGDIRYDEDNIFRECIESVDNKNLRNKVKKLEKLNDKNYKKYKHDVEEVIQDRIRLGYYKCL